jgi:hypothetical protein
MRVGKDVILLFCISLRTLVLLTNFVKDLRGWLQNGKE